MKKLLCKLKGHKPNKEKILHYKSNHGGRIDVRIVCTRCGTFMGLAEVRHDLT